MISSRLPVWALQRVVPRDVLDALLDELLEASESLLEGSLGIA